MIKKPLKVAKFLKMTCQSDTLDPHISPDTLINILPQPLELYFSSLANQKKTLRDNFWLSLLALIEKRTFIWSHKNIHPFPWPCQGEVFARRFWWTSPQLRCPVRGHFPWLAFSCPNSEGAWTIEPLWTTPTVWRLKTGKNIFFRVKYCFSAKKGP